MSDSFKFMWSLGIFFFAMHSVSSSLAITTHYRRSLGQRTFSVWNRFIMHMCAIFWLLHIYTEINCGGYCSKWVCFLFSCVAGHSGKIHASDFHSGFFFSFSSDDISMSQLLSIIFVLLKWLKRHKSFMAQTCDCFLCSRELDKCQNTIFLSHISPIMSILLATSHSGTKENTRMRRTKWRTRGNEKH